MPTRGIRVPDCLDEQTSDALWMQEQQRSQAQAVIGMHDGGVGPVWTAISRGVRAIRVLGDIELAQVLVGEMCKIQDTSGLQRRLH